MRPAVLAFFLALSTTAPLLAGEMPPMVSIHEQGSGMTPIAFGDGPPTGPRRARHARSGDIAKPIEPYHADMNGATRESADKAYRKRYGF